MAAPIALLVAVSYLVNPQSWHEAEWWVFAALGLFLAVTLALPIFMTQRGRLELNREGIIEGFVTAGLERGPVPLVRFVGIDFRTPPPRLLAWAAALMQRMNGYHRSLPAWFGGLDAPALAKELERARREYLGLPPHSRSDYDQEHQARVAGRGGAAGWVPADAKTGDRQDAVRRYLTRIAEVDRLLHAVIEVNPEAMHIAAELDDERRAGKRRGPLHGWPILIKDNIDTADRMMTTAGSLALVGAPTPKQDAGMVMRLHAAGAVILGKTNLSEWANISSSRSTSGWSGRGGQTCNPHALDRNPSGSSSGSGAAVAASLCAAAVGTETDGSIVSPSATTASWESSRQWAC